VRNNQLLRLLRQRVKHPQKKLLLLQKMDLHQRHKRVRHRRVRNKRVRHRRVRRHLVRHPRKHPQLRLKRLQLSL
jgi:hypothetical protein